MSEDNKEAQTFTTEDVEKIVAERLEKEVLGLKAKNEELLGENKKFKSAAQELEEAQRSKEEQRAKEQGEWKLIAENKEKELSELRANVEAERKRVTESEIDRAVLGIASSLTKDERKQAVLTKVLRDNIKYSEKGVEYSLDGQAVERGSLVDYVKSNYDFAIDGNPASGDGAKGSGLKGNTSGVKPSGQLSKEDRAAQINARLKS